VIRIILMTRIIFFPSSVSNSVSLFFEVLEPWIDSMNLKQESYSPKPPFSSISKSKEQKSTLKPWGFVVEALSGVSSFDINLWMLIGFGNRCLIVVPVSGAASLDRFWVLVTDVFLILKYP